MKKLLIVLVMIAVCSFLLVGCTSTGRITPEPDVPVMEAITDAELVKGVPHTDPWTIEWSIVNVGDVFIEAYVLTFDVYYPVKDNVILEVAGSNLGVGKFHEGTLTLLDYDTTSPETVSVSCELFD